MGDDGSVGITTETRSMVATTKAAVSTRAIWRTRSKCPFLTSPSMSVLRPSSVSISASVVALTVMTAEARNRTDGAAASTSGWVSPSLPTPTATRPAASSAAAVPPPTVANWMSVRIWLWSSGVRSSRLSMGVRGDAGQPVGPPGDP